MRTRRNILETLVDIFAGFFVIKKLVTGSASADRSAFGIFAVLRTGMFEVRACVRSFDFLTGFVVFLQNIIRRTLTLVGALRVFADVGADRWIDGALVDVFTGRTVLLNNVACSAAAVITSGLVDAIVIATVELTRLVSLALVYI